MKRNTYYGRYSSNTMSLKANVVANGPIITPTKSVASGPDDVAEDKPTVNAHAVPVWTCVPLITELNEFPVG